MKRTGTFFSLSFKILLKNWRMTILLLLIPLALVATLGVTFSALFHKGEQVKSFSVSIVDEDNTFETQFILQQFTENEELHKLITPIETDINEANRLLKRNTIAAIIIVPEGFSEGLKNGENIPVEVIGNSRRPLQSELVAYLMKSAADFVSASQSGINTVYKFSEDAGFSESELEKEFRSSLLSFSFHVLERNEAFSHDVVKGLFSQNVIQYYAVSFYVLLIMFWSYGGLFLLRTKQTKALNHRFVSRHISLFSISIGKGFALLLLISLCSLLIGVPIFESLGLKAVENSWIFGGLTVISAFFFISLFILIEALTKRIQFYQLCGLFFMIVSALLGGHLIPPVYFPEGLLWLEVYYPNSMILKSFLALFSGEEYNHFLKSSLSLFFLSCAFLALTLMKFKLGRGEK
ncbi:ABC transporter permease [Priestia filamentosa]|uniref:ABC transporter permease n=1 Tax=Priestia filamentosa TaxID=1402861 RepID=UPI001FB3FAED|nr:ABC transporter permease [Priestia filamentosa]UOE59614.1 ABC transporter permease [Priestia filamentosa]